MEVIGAEKGLTHREMSRVVKSRLHSLYRSPGRSYRLNAREASETGRQYTDEAVDAGELAYALGRCTPRQQRILQLWLGPKKLHQAWVAHALGVSLVTVKRDAAAAIRTMAAVIWGG